MTTSRLVTADRRKHCPACRKLVEVGEAAVVVNRAVRSPINRPTRPRSSLYHYECWKASSAGHGR